MLKVAVILSVLILVSCREKCPACFTGKWTNGNIVWEIVPEDSGFSFISQFSEKFPPMRWNSAGWKFSGDTLYHDQDPASAMWYIGDDTLIGYVDTFIRVED